MSTGKNAPQMKSQMIEGMMRCFIAERGIAMFNCMFVGGFVNSLIYSLLVSYNTGVLGVCSLSVAFQSSSYVVFTLIFSAPTGKVSI